jgi:hypothetical protein
LGITDDPTPHKKELTEFDKLNYDIMSLSPENRKKAEEYISLLKTRADFMQELSEKRIQQVPEPQT